MVVVMVGVVLAVAGQVVLLPEALVRGVPAAVGLVAGNRRGVFLITRRGVV